ncbi:TRAP transporter solute receptor, unknown substrate 6 [Richelia intracellularis HM01]|nr:TRAP transporter solute receptor, unknown substrate 6 [Richelia intracellularis HM01]
MNGEALARLVAGGTKLVAYSQEIMEAAQKATLEIFEENAIKDAQFKQIYKQWKEFRDKIYRWNRVNELSFANFTTKKLSL